MSSSHGGGSPLSAQQVNALDLESDLLSGRYAVHSDLGSGSFGRVVGARDLQLDRDVAIKLIPVQGDGTSREVDGLLKEARLAASLAPAAVSIFDVLTSPNGIGIVMEVLVKGSLVPAVRAGTPPERAYDLGRASVESMAMIHAAGVLHLDIHPGNLLVRTPRSVAVADFGLARLRGARGFSHGRHELAWTAPELLNFGVASPQADVYALGLVLRWIERRSGARFGDVVDRACAADRHDRPADARALLDQLLPFDPASVEGGAA